MTKEKKEEEKENKTIEIPKKFEKLIQDIENMSVIDLAELVKILEKKFGVSAMAPTVTMPVVASTTSISETASAQEKNVFNIELITVGDKKIEVIKLIKDTTQKGLKEAKDLVDATVTSPQMIKENVKKEEAEELKKKFEAVGAKVELK
jgi:large subunit ribosomal protein L7/L12